MRISLCLLVWLALPLVAKADAANNCEKLKEAGTPQLAIRNAQIVGAGALQLPPGPFGPVDTTKLPGFCRVQGSLHPTSDSDIKFELWMPETNWNRRYVQLGNGGKPEVTPEDLISPLLPVCALG